MFNVIFRNSHAAVETFRVDQMIGHSLINAADVIL